MVQYTDPTSMDMRKTLARRLIPVADRLRNLFTKFGLRPYKVRFIKVRWSGGQRGVGKPVIEKEHDILPTPLVQDISTLIETVHPIGLDECGSILVSEISGRFSDEDLRFLDRYGNPPGVDEEVYFEIEFPRPDGLPGDTRRFFPRSAPFYNAGRFQWQIRLERSHEGRGRNGDYE